MLGGRRKREGEGRHGQRGENMEEEREGRGTKGGEREKRHSLHPLIGLQNFHTVEHSLLACMFYFLVNNCHLNLSPANSFCSDIYTCNRPNNDKMTIGYTPVLSALNAFQARESNSAVNSALRSKSATAG